MTRSYHELRRLETFEDRFQYLRLQGDVGAETFGFDRWINQEFYCSHEWKRVRNEVIVRDNGCDLGIPGLEIFKSPVIHHLNPMTVEQISHGEEAILNPDNLITTTLDTHNAIHYGRVELISRRPIERTPGDTRLW